MKFGTSVSYINVPSKNVWSKNPFSHSHTSLKGVNKLIPVFPIILDRFRRNKVTGDHRLMSWNICKFRDIQ